MYDMFELLRLFELSEKFEMFELFEKLIHFMELHDNSECSETLTAGIWERANFQKVQKTIIADLEHSECSNNYYGRSVYFQNILIYVEIDNTSL